MDSEKYIARLLRSDVDTISRLHEKMAARFGKDGVLDTIATQNQLRASIMLEKLGIRDRKALPIFKALIGKVREDDTALKKAFGISGSDGTGYGVLAQRAVELAGLGSGFFLKWEKAAELIRKNPPQNILSFFGYRDAGELLEKENIKKVFAALRFAEDRKWLNTVFFAAYNDLEAADFEKRSVEMLVLENKWLAMAEHFVQKKYHNVSHLKELGMIFVLPQDLAVPGEALRLFTLLLHYLHEIHFYSELFEKKVHAFSDPLWTEGQSFADFFTSALRGDIVDKRLPDGNALTWLIVQRYLAKEDENDWRLFEPHINPEALHWERAEENISHIGEKFPHLDLSFWHDLGWIGDFYPTDTGVEVLVSMNLVDTVMALVMNKELIKYLYHHQEALWNKIFAMYAGKDEIRRFVIQNFSHGYISL
ncbi:MAG: hypothetical protein HYS44_02550 [Candidatus Niyogibacteria bacterium]|nr:hypothetical protein [Candidatus Niyogibacteria bacterium]